MLLHACQLYCRQRHPPEIPLVYPQSYLRANQVVNQQNLRPNSPAFRRAADQQRSRLQVQLCYRPKHPHFHLRRYQLQPQLLHLPTHPHVHLHRCRRDLQLHPLPLSQPLHLHICPLPHQQLNPQHLARVLLAFQQTNPAFLLL